MDAELGLNAPGCDECAKPVPSPAERFMGGRLPAGWHRTVNGEVFCSEDCYRVWWAGLDLQALTPLDVMGSLEVQWLEDMEGCLADGDLLAPTPLEDPDDV